MAEFQQSLFGCFSNCTLCLVTYFAPCYTAGKNAEAVGESCILYGFLSLLGCIGIYTRAKIRGKIRETKGIEININVKKYVAIEGKKQPKQWSLARYALFEGSFGHDCLLSWFCGLCALIQESAEVGGTCGEAQAMVRE